MGGGGRGEVMGRYGWVKKLRMGVEGRAFRIIWALGFIILWIQ